MNYPYYMEKALDQAEKALAANEFPVGCVIVYREEVVANGSRTGTVDGKRNEIDHAEVNALKKLSGMNIDYENKDLAIFTTMEPCLMCYGAILLSGAGEIVYAYEDVMGGGTLCDLSRMPPLYKNREISIVPYVMRQESLDFFKTYFSNPENDYWRDSLLAKYTLEQV